MSDGVSVKEILQALQRRGGFKPPNPDPRVGVFETLRETSNWTGTVSAAQIDTLKRTLMLLADSKSVTIGLDMDQRKMFWSTPLPPKKNVDSEVCAAVRATLGVGWDVSAVKDGMIGGDDTRPESTSRAAPKRKGAGGAKKTRRRPFKKT